MQFIVYRELLKLFCFFNATSKDSARTKPLIGSYIVMFPSRDAAFSAICQSEQLHISSKHDARQRGPFASQSCKTSQVKKFLVS